MSVILPINNTYIFINTILMQKYINAYLKALENLVMKITMKTQNSLKQKFIFKNKKQWEYPQRFLLAC